MTKSMFAHNPATGQIDEVDAGPRTGWVTFTPQRAQEVLDTRNTRNRRVNPGAITRYARDMAAGHWYINGDSIRFATDGTLLDGQNRLAAIVRSGVTLRLLVVWNLPPESQATMDDGWKRTMANVLELQGRTTHAKTAASIIRRVILFDQGAYRSNQRQAPTKQEMAAFLEENPRIWIAAEIADHIRSSKGVRCAASTLGLAYFLFDRVSPKHAETFFQGLRTGAGLNEDSPILFLRNKLSFEGSTRLQTETAEVLAWFIKSWNAWRAGKSIRLLRQRSGESFPEPK
jgi:predicted SprT family Zn-dependent metalloprotease